MLSAASLNLVACASIEIPELRPAITQPASQDGFRVNTLKDEEQIIPAEAWKKYLADNAHVILFSDDWAKLRFTILKNCLTMECKQSVGALDGLFYAVDDALKKKKLILKK